MRSRNWRVGLGLVLACAMVLLGGLALTQWAGPPPVTAHPAAPPPPRKPVAPPSGAQDTPAQLPAHSPDRHGGPDGFGYVYDDSSEPGGPGFSWIAGTTVISDMHGRDDYTTTVSLPFTFYFYGGAYTSINISTNGNLNLFDSGNTDYVPDCMPDPAYTSQLGILAPFWDDMDLRAHGDVYTGVSGAAPNRIFTIEWRDVGMYSRTADLTYEVLLYESTGGPSEIRYQYLSLTGDTSAGSRAAVGIQSPDRSTGLAYNCFSDALHNNLAVRFRVVPGVPIYPGDQSAGAAAGNTVTYAGQIINQTGITNSFTLSLAGNSWPSTLVPTQTGQISNAVTVPFTVAVAIPSCTTLGADDTVTLLVSSSLPNPGTYTSTVQLHTTVNTTGAAFTPASNTQSGAPNTTVIFTSTLTNQSGSSNTFTLSPSGNTYTTTVAPASVALASNASVPVTVSVQIPPNAELGHNDRVTILAQQTPPGTCPYYAQAVFTTTLGSWALRAYPTYPRDRHALVSYPGTGLVYALGGETSGGNRNLPIEAFDPIANQWSVRSSLRAPVSNVGGAVLGDGIYVPGGFDGVGATTWLQVYHPASDVAEVIYSDPLPAPRYGAGVAAVGGKLYVIGGSDNISGTNTVFQYDPARPATTRWQRKADMPTARVYLGVGVVNGIIYAAGGTPGSPPTDLSVLEAYNPATDSWTTLHPMTTPRGALAVVGVDSSQPCGGYLYAFGGGWSSYLTSVERYDPTTDTWTPLSSMGQGRRSLAAAYSTNGAQIIVHGGWNGFYLLATEALGCGGGPGPSPTPTPPGGAPTATPHPLVTATPLPCALPFSDVHTTDYFYLPVQFLYCRGIVSGYNDQTFRPGLTATRGQLAKMVALAFGWDLSNPGPQVFTDVPPTHPFFAYVNVAAARGVLSGYSSSPPCTTGTPCFLPGNNITRSQLTKIIVNAAGWAPIVPGTPTFSDVATSDPFYSYVETAVYHRILSGYDCGGPGEPCDPAHSPYFRGGNNATRGQLSKILYNALTFPLAGR